MGNTREGNGAVIKGNMDALELSAEQSDLLMDFDAFDLNREITDLLVKPKDTRVAVKDYILACGAKEANSLSKSLRWFLLYAQAGKGNRLNRKRKRKAGREGWELCSLWLQYPRRKGHAIFGSLVNRAQVGAQRVWEFVLVIPLLIL